MPKPQTEYIVFVWIGIKEQFYDSYNEQRLTGMCVEHSFGDNEHLAIQAYNDLIANHPTLKIALIKQETARMISRESIGA